MNISICQNPVLDYRDKIVRRVDDFPELVRALRECDFVKGRTFCAQLFPFDAPEKSRARQDDACPKKL